MEQLTRDLLKSLDRRLDAAVPESVRARSPGALHRARSVIALALLLIPGGLLMSGVLHGLLGSHMIAWMADAFVLKVGLAAAFVLFSGRVRPAVYVIGFGTYSCLLGAVTLTGGHDSGFIALAVAALLITAVLHTHLGAIAWAVAYVVGIAAIVVMDVGMGVHFDDTLPPTASHIILAVGLPFSLLLVAATTWLDRTLQARARSEAEALATDLRRALGVAEEAGRARQAFLTTMSHELRNPLNAVFGSIELLQLRDDLSPEVRAHVDRVNRAGEALLDVVNDTLDWSRFEAGHLELDRSEVSLHAVVIEVADLLADRAARMDLDLDVDVPDDPLLVLADPSRLRQVLLNLVVNALTYTRRGGVSVVATRQADRIVVEVRDTGPGIAPADLVDLFEPFTRAESDRHRRPRGSGLGLTISHRLAAAMGATLTVRSKVGRGTTFQVLFPVETLVAAAEPRPQDRDVARVG